MKNCPYCEGQLMDTVVRCVHCGKDLNTPESDALAAKKAGEDGGDPANPLAQAAAMPTAGGAPSVNQMPEPVEEQDFSDQPEYFVMKTEMTAPGAKPAVSTKPRSGVANTAGIATASALLSVVSALIIAASLWGLSIATVSVGGQADRGPRFGVQELPMDVQTLKLFNSGWESWVIFGFGLALLTGGAGYLTKQDARALKGFVLLDAAVVGVVTWMISNTLQGIDDILAEVEEDLATQTAGMFSEAEMAKIITQLPDLVTVEVGPAMTALWVAVGVATVAGVLGLMIKGEPKMPAAPTQPPPAGSYPPPPPTGA